MDYLEPRYLSFEWVQDVLQPYEGELWHVYGKPKNGKTLEVVKMAIELLEAGQTVIANFKIKWNGFDESKDWWCLLLGLLGIKKEFFKFPKENFIYVDPADSKMAEKLAYWTDCTIILDEGQRYYDSYKLTKMEESVRMAIALTAHFNRRIIIASQRSMAIHVSLRGNVNRFFKMEKLYKIPFTDIARFQVTEYLEMQGENVDETKPESESRFWGTHKLYDLYDYKFMRGDMPRSQPNYATAKTMTMKEKWGALMGTLKKGTRLSRKDEIDIEEIEMLR